MTERMRVPLPLALLLENVKSGGAAEAEILAALESGTFDGLREQLVDPAMDLEDRARLAADMQVDWRRVWQEGYSIGFLHTNGLKRWLRFRYGMLEGTHYVQDGNSLKRLLLTREQAAELDDIAGLQWNVIEAPEGGHYVLQHKSEAEERG